MYVREVDEQVLTLRVSGKLWMRSLVMSDVETGTEWSHLLGRAMAGELKGETLRPLITDMVTWRVWKEQYPETTLLNLSNTSKNYTEEFYRDPRRFVFGFVVGGKAYSLPMQSMMRQTVLPIELGQEKLLATFDNRGAVIHLFDCKLDGQTLHFTADGERAMRDRETGSRWDTLSGKATAGPLRGKLLEQRVGIMSFRKAWQNFYPDSKEIEFVPAAETTDSELR